MKKKIPTGPESQHEVVVHAAFERLAKHEPTPELLAKVVDEIDGLLRGETKETTGEPTLKSPDGFNQYENRVMRALCLQGERLTRAQLTAVRDALAEALAHNEKMSQHSTGGAMAPVSIIA